MQKKNFKRQSYLRLISYVKPYKKVLFIGIIAGIMTGGFFGASFFWLKGFVKPFEKNAPPPIAEHTLDKKKEKPESSTQKQQEIRQKGAKKLDSVITIANRFGIHVRNEQGKMTFYGLLLFVGSFVFVWFLKNAATYINKYCMRWVGTRVITDMRKEIFDKLINQSMLFYGKADVGQLISRSVADTNQIQAGVSKNIAQLTSAPFQILGCVGFIIFVSYTNDNFVLLLAMAVTGLGVLIPILMIGRKVRKIYKKAYQKIADVMSKMHEIFSGIILVKASYTENYESKRFSGVNENYFRSLIKALKAELLMSPFTEFLGVVGIGGFFVYAYLDRIPLSQIVVLVVPAMLAYQPMRALAKVANGIQKCMAAADRYFNIIDTEVKLTEANNPERLTEFKDKIVFENVDFSYQENSEYVLKNINFTLSKGKMIAVVGQTGSGKSTIANLLARFYDVSSGRVSIDGVDVRDIKISDLRELVGIVTQNTILFNDTIANNIAYGVPDVTREDVIEAAKKANAHNFIVDGAHADGYDTIVGEKGFVLSGGEKQRVAIARAILKNPPILILDEATSALDTVTESLVQHALFSLMENRTVFAIAHRISTIKHADEILVLDEGEIVEKGCHEELINRENGAYRELYELQFNQ